MNAIDPPLKAARTPTTDADLLAAEAALRRSARNALELARATGTPCYVWVDGKMVDIAAPAASLPGQAHSD